MTTYEWKKYKWIFENDGSLRDIYVNEIQINDWEILIDFLNENFSLKYGVLPRENKELNVIDKDYVIELLTDETGKMECRTASIIIDNIVINTHFFSDQQIEFDIDPREINSSLDFERILQFMRSISSILQKEIILSAENSESDFPLIKVDVSKEITNILTEEEAKRLW